MKSNERRRKNATEEEKEVVRNDNTKSHKRRRKNTQSRLNNTAIGQHCNIDYFLFINVITFLILLIFLSH